MRAKLRQRAGSITAALIALGACACSAAEPRPEAMAPADAVPGPGDGRSVSGSGGEAAGSGSTATAAGSGAPVTGVGVGSDAGVAPVGMPDAAVQQDGDTLTLPDPSLPAVLDRPATLDVTCSVTRPPQPLGLAAPARLRDAVALDAQLHVVWTEPAPLFEIPSENLMLASLGSDGVLQPAQVVFEPPVPGASFTKVKAIAGPDRFTVCWDHMPNDEATLLPGPGVTGSGAIDASSGVLQFDAADDALAAPRPFDLSHFTLDASVRATEDGYLAAWSEGSGSSSALRFARLDAELVPQRPVASLVQGQGAVEGVADIAQNGAGVSLIYVRPAGDLHGTVYRRFDADGAALGLPIQLKAPDAFYSGGVLLARGDETLAAWTVTEGEGLSVDQTHTSIRLARFSADGTLQGDVLVLASDDAGLVHTWVASFVDLGDSVGLLWTREQKVEPACTEACRSEATVHFVVLAADDLAQHSEPVELRVEGPDSPGLGVFRSVRLGGDELLVLMNRFSQSNSAVGWSTLESSPVSATLGCTR